MDMQQAAETSLQGEPPVAASFGNDSAARQAALKGVAVCDRSHWGRIEIAGGDRVRYLHNQSTNDFQRLQSGEGCDTVFVTSTARTLDLATVYVLETHFLVLVSPQRHQQILAWLDRYIFPMDQVSLKDCTADTAALSLIGPESQALLAGLGLPVPDGPHGQHLLGTLGEAEVRVAVGSGLAAPGYTLICAAQDRAALWQGLVEAGAVPMGDRAWEQLRIEQGRPAPDCELTEDYNPLEAGLWHTISFNKGCYIGQETIARLDTYKGVKQQLWGLRLSQPVEPGTPILLNDEKVGLVTSVTEASEGAIGLGYVRTKAGGAGLTARAGEAIAEVVEIPFVTRDRSAALGVSS